MKHTQYRTPKTRADLFTCYVENAVEYLKTVFPEVPEKDLYAYVQNYCNSELQAMSQRTNTAMQDLDNFDPDQLRSPEDRLLPTADVIQHSSMRGEDGRPYSTWNETKFKPLWKLTNEHVSDIISPYGTCYTPVSAQSSFLKGLIDVKMKQRKTEKKAMLKAKKEGDKVAAVFHNNNQATIKILMNSLIGAMGSGFNFLSSIANFNSVTSIARFFIMNAYAHAERFLEGNFYFRDEEQVLNHLICCKRKGPDSSAVSQIVRRHGWYIPSVDDVYAFLTDNLHRYCFESDHPVIRDFLYSLNDGERCFVFYMSNMYQLVTRNTWYFKTWCDRFFDTGGVDYSLECVPGDLLHLDGDLCVVLSTVCHSWMPTNERGNSVSLGDVVQQDPELARRLYCVGRHMQSCIDEIQEAFDIFMDHKVGIGYVHEHKQMFRSTVILSDTDSIIFTTKSWAEWYCGSTSISDQAFNINALAVYWLTKANANILYHVSCAFGALDADLVRMNMKNEFMMPIEILTSLKKHYASILAIQEGVFYGKPKLDIKGVNLRGSNFSKPTLNYVTWFIQDVIDEIKHDGKVSARNRICDILRFERMIFDDLQHGSTKYLQVEPIRMAGEYKDADRTIYFNYLFWEKVFADKYGNIAIPTKCFILPLENVRYGIYMAYLRNNFPEIADKLEDFFKEYPDKEIARIPINPLTNEIPEELRFVTNFKAVVYANTRPLYLIMQSFGITPGNSKKQTILFSDIYGWATAEEGVKAIVHTED